ncbi:hypothetical protein [Mediterraneibacter gnavus]|uniref:hypothetical protein n=1 Tax=Mediterraneibacter gnavus TaxID=33038 RepID=UPI0004652990|nr:hypothetical protein [Mediterraneibacter gnavus]
MDIINTIAFLALYYILGLGTMVALISGVYEDAKLELEDYLMALLFPFVLFVVFVDWIVRKIVR